MSTTSLPSYIAPPASAFPPTPTYTAEPQASEQRIAHNPALRLRPSSEFTKQSKAGGIALRLLSQEENISLPVYGIGDVVDGIVDITKTDGVHAVDVKVSTPYMCVPYFRADIQAMSSSKVLCGSKRSQKEVMLATTSASRARHFGVRTVTMVSVLPRLPLHYNSLQRSTMVDLNMYAILSVR
jgi:hypothetical protein